MSEIPKHIRYIVAKPRMKKYIEYAADIYDIYLDYIDPNDIHVYSIDEAFLDVTAYLKMYNMEKVEFAKFLKKPNLTNYFTSSNRFGLVSATLRITKREKVWLFLLLRNRNFFVFGEEKYDFCHF